MVLKSTELEYVLLQFYVFRVFLIAHSGIFHLMDHVLFFFVLFGRLLLLSLQAPVIKGRKP